MTDIALFVQTAATWALVGLIWTMQIVHYPLFAGVGRDGYPAWQKSHMARVTVVVGPLMVCEALAALRVLLSALRAGEAAQLPLAWTGCGLLAAIWLSTALVQAPLHGRLAAGYDAGLQRRLVRTNWVRTVLWTARGVVVLVQLSRGLRSG